jgi:hypothetical protein
MHTVCNRLLQAFIKAHTSHSNIVETVTGMHVRSGDSSSVNYSLQPHSLIELTRMLAHL